MYKIRMTQNEVNAYYLGLYYTCIDRYKDEIFSMRYSFAGYTSNEVLAVDNHSKWIDPNCKITDLHVKEHYISLNNCSQQNIKYSSLDKYKYIVTLSQIEVILLNSISGLVSGDYDNSMRRYFNGSEGGGTMIFERIFGFDRYMDTIISCEGNVRARTIC